MTNLNRITVGNQSQILVERETFAVCLNATSEESGETCVDSYESVGVFFLICVREHCTILIDIDIS